MGAQLRGERTHFCVQFIHSDYLGPGKEDIDMSKGELFIGVPLTTIGIRRRSDGNLALKCYWKDCGRWGLNSLLLVYKMSSLHDPR